MYTSLHELYTWDWHQPKRMHHRIRGARAHAERVACDRHADYHDVPRDKVRAEYWGVIP